MTSKAEQPTTHALKPCPNAEAIAQEIADRTRWKKNTDTYARIYQAAYAGAIAALNTRTTSLAAQDGLVEALTYLESEARRFAGMYPEASDGRNTFLIFADKIASVSAIKGDKS